MPRYTPNIKIERTRSHGAEVLLHGEDFDAASAHADTLASQRGLTLVHPYDDLEIIAGQGTVALEMLEAYPRLEMLVVPIGGGGLISGMATAAKAVKPDIEIVGVQTQRYPSMYCAVRDEPGAFGPSTIAEGIAVGKPGKLTLGPYELTQRLLQVIEQRFAEETFDLDGNPPVRSLCRQKLLRSQIGVHVPVAP